MDIINPAVAKSYRDYRNYKQDFVKMLDEVYKKSQSIMYIGDKENSNTDSALVSTKRSLVFNQLNKELYKKFFLTTEELQACNDGYIYIHDMSARRDTMNCCLFDVGNVLKGGFEMGNVWYNEPKTLDTAFDVIGDIVSASAKRVGPFPPRIKDVGVTIDLAIHDLDVMNYLFDEDVIQVYGTMNSILEKCEFEDHAEIMINFKNESTGILEVNWLTPYKRRQIEITGTDGIISVDYIEQSIDVYGKFAQDIDIKHEEPLKEELRSFLNAVVNGTEPEITGEDGLKALKMVIAATKSSREHKPISFDEIE